MTAKLLDNRSRVVGLTLALAVHGLLVALLLLSASDPRPENPPREQLVAVAIDSPPPPPPRTEAPAPASPAGQASAALPPHPLASPIPAEPATESGASTAAGSGEGEGEGNGTGGGPGGSGTGGAVIPPQRVAGALTNADYRDARAPKDAAGTVVVEFRVGADGTVQYCAVLRSSGYAVFDQATCRLIRQRFRYRPAQDGSGHPIEWTIRTDYTWAPR